MILQSSSASPGASACILPAAPAKREAPDRTATPGAKLIADDMPPSRQTAKPASDAGANQQNPDGLRNIGLKATGPRLRILELFQTSGVRHMSAEDVYRQLLAEKIEVGLATVYRVLTQFEQAGLLERHHFESGKSVFELNEGSHHDHLVCLQCGRVEEFYDAEIERRQSRIAAERGFALHDHSLSLYADCVKPECPYRGTPGASAGSAR